MKTLIKERDIQKLAKGYKKDGLDVKLLAVDYKWADKSDEKNFYNVYVLTDVEKVDRLILMGSRDGEMWDLENTLEECYTFEEKGKQYGIFKLELENEEIFPRAFVIKGIGESEFYDNNESRNYVIKKGRGGNIIPKKKKIILLNSIELYSLFDK